MCDKTLAEWCCLQVSPAVYFESKNYILVGNKDPKFIGLFLAIFLTIKCEMCYVSSSFKKTSLTRCGLGPAFSLQS